MFTVALIGPDGAGKTTVGRQLERSLALPTKYLYMGTNADASNHLLPTTRLVRAWKRACGAQPAMRGPRPHTALQSPDKRGWRRATSRIKAGLSLTNRLCEEWFRQLVAWHYQLRRYVVVFDRHYFHDYHAYDIQNASRQMPLGRRIHGWLLSHVYPRPDLVIYLDAPPEVLLARKGEGTLELLQRRREDYLSLRTAVKHFLVVDASRPTDDVVREVSRCVRDFHAAQADRRRSQ
jgi:thymidylate kinase